MLTNLENKPSLFLRPRQTDRKVLESVNTIGCYDGIHLGTNMPPFIVRLVNQLGKNAFNDPVTYLFALPAKKLINENGKVKPSIKRLGEKYGPLISKIVGKRALRPDDILKSKKNIISFVKHVTDLQVEQFEGQQFLLNPYYDKYSKWASSEAVALNIPSNHVPNVVIPPYFFFTTHGDDWYQASIECAKSSLSLSNKPIYPTLLFSRKLLLDELAIHRVIDDFTNLKVEGYFIWPNDFNEEDELKDSLIGLIKLVKGLSKTGRTVFKLYGSYFSLLLYAYGLKGFSCGLGYGISKNAFAYTSRGGGVFEPKYYIPRLHRSLELEDAERLLRAYPTLRCGCQICTSIYGNNMDGFMRMRENGHCELHFLKNRYSEINLLAKKGVAGALDTLRETLKEFEGNLIVNTYSLKNWLEVINLNS